MTTVTVELTYEMSRVLGVRRLEIEGAATVQEALQVARARFAARAADFDRLTRLTSVVHNGVLLRHGEAGAARLSAGDVVGFLRAAAGG